MTNDRGSRMPLVAWGVEPIRLADNEPPEPNDRMYALPYYTRAGGETELLVSNPGPATVTGIALIYGRECGVTGKEEIKLQTNCTLSIRMRAIEPDHAGHVVMIVDGPVLAHVVYASNQDLAIVGNSMTGAPEFVGWLRAEKSRTYAFGYRAKPLSDAFADGAVFISNPSNQQIDAIIAFYDERCSIADKCSFQIEPGCTVECNFPASQYGYGRIEITGPAVINVVHFADKDGSVAAAEQLADGDRIDGGVPPRVRANRVLFDDTHACRPGTTGDYIQFEAALTASGHTVAHLTGVVDLVTLEQHDVFVVSVARQYYSSAEMQAITDFVNGGGGLLLCQDYGLRTPIPPSPWTHPMRQLLYLFGAADEENLAEDALHNTGSSGWILFETPRNFSGHPVMRNIKSFSVDAVCTLSGSAGWTTIAETDDDSSPVRRPVLMGRGFGTGRVLVIGDSNTFADHLIGNFDNANLSVSSIEWLLFKI